MVLTCDYLILGAGAQGLAFADALLAGKRGCKVIIVDSHSNPGGQWNDTYAFARLDQPSNLYGVPSKRLEEAKLNSTGASAERASRDKILSYFNRVMECLIKNHKVQYFPNCTAQIMGSGLGSSTVRITPCFMSDEETKVRDVRVLRKVVYSPSATIQTSFSSCAYSFQIGTGVCIVRPHELTYHTMAQRRPMYVVIGSGRTGIDTILWLLSNHVPPENLHWVMPRDSWFHCSEALESILNYNVKTHELAASAPSVEALFLACEQARLLCRIDEERDPEISPSLHLSLNDLTALRKVHNIIRLGHVRKITTEHLELDNGVSEICEGALCIDCTSKHRKYEAENMPVFSSFQIALQPVAEVWGGTCEQNVSFHAAFIGFLEGQFSGNEEIQNSFCTPVNVVDHRSTYFENLLLHMQTMHKIWSDQKMLAFFMARPSRFNAMPHAEFRKLTQLQALQKSSLENLGKIMRAKSGKCNATMC